MDRTTRSQSMDDTTSTGSKHGDTTVSYKCNNKKKQPVAKNSGTVTGKTEQSSTADVTPRNCPQIVASVSQCADSFDDADTATMNKDELIKEVLSLRQSVHQLRQQMDFLLSFVGITDGKRESTNDHEVHDSVAAASTASHIEKHAITTFAAAVTRSIQSKTCRDEMMTAVYVEQSDKLKRSKRFMVAGMPEMNGGDSDQEQVIKLCREGFDIDPDVVSIQRVGRLQDGRPRLLKVSMRSQEQANTIICSAKQLRSSNDEYIRRHVYINPDYTKAEAKANYEIRQRRRHGRTVLQNQGAAGQHSLNPTAPPFTSTIDDSQPSESVRGDRVNGGSATSGTTTAAAGT